MPAPIGIIGGTALAGMADVTDEYRIPHSPYGPPSGPLLRGRVAGRDVLFLARHGADHRLPPHKINYRANIRALADTGVEQVIAASAVGGITPDMSAGRIVIPHQIIDYSWGREHSFSDDVGDLLHVDFTEPYDADLRRILIEVAEKLDLDPAERAVHGITQGPRLETAAEIDRMERDGCDIVGMTGMPEAVLAREAGLAYACCAVVVNPAAGRGSAGIHDDIMRTIERGTATVARVLQTALAAL